MILRDIPGYEGRYAASSDGLVFSLNYKRTGCIKELKGGKSPDGYRYLTLRLDGRNITFRRSHLILEAFGFPRPSGAEVDHQNNIRDDDRLINLSWTTHLENVRRIWRQNRRTMRGTKNTRVFLTEEKVREIRRDYAQGKGSYSQIATTHGLRKGHVADIVTNRIWSHLE